VTAGGDERTERNDEIWKETTIFERNDEIWKETTIFERNDEIWKETTIFERNARDHLATKTV